MLWDHRNASSPQPQTMLAGDANLYVAGADGTFVALTARSGTPRWTGAAPGTSATGSVAVPVGAGSGIVVVAHRGGTGGYFNALNAKSGHALWQSTDPVQGGTIASGSAYLAGGGSSQRCDS